MTTKHTPGPWSLETVRTSCGVCHKVGPFPGRRENDKPRHACLYADYPSESNPADQELLANANLISAAPELLDALEGLLAVSVDTSPAELLAMIAARAAIDKARGSQ